MHGQRTWADAQTFCEDEGAFLATARDSVEASFVWQLCKQGGRECWIGLTDQASEGSWVWTTSPTSSAGVPWSATQPDNQNNQDCAQMWQLSGSVAAVNDAACTDTLSHVCKKPEGCPPGNLKRGSTCVPCPVGTYSSSANFLSTCTPCGPGRYGSTTGQKEATCTGAVSAGHFSTGSATSATQSQCPAGRYASVTGSTSAQCEGPIAAGYYGAAGSTTDKPSGKQCAAGRFGGIGQTSSQCSGPCDAGYWCPLGSVSSQANACGGASRFCPSGSAAASTVKSGSYTKPESGNTRSSEAVCEAGWFCSGGSRSKCRAGYFGASTGRTSDTCDGKCDVAGFICPAGSTKKTQEACGEGQTDPADWYCAAGATTRTQVSAGHYSTPLASPVSQRSGQQTCEAGFACSKGLREPDIAFTGPGQLCTTPDLSAGASPHDYLGELEVPERSVAAALATVGVKSVVGTPVYSIRSEHAATSCTAVAGQGAGSTGHPFRVVSSSATALALGVKAGAALDFEACSLYRLVISATRAGTTAKCTVTVRVRDVNDPPYFLDERGATITSASRTVPEGSDINTLVGLPVTAGDQDAGQELRFSIAEGDPRGAFAIGACSGQVHVATTDGKALLDHEADGPTGGRSPHFRLVVTVRDNASPTRAEVNLTLSVTVSNVDEPPFFTKAAYSLAVDENSPAGTAVAPAAGFTASDPDGPSSTLTWTLTSLDGDGSGGTAPFAIGASTGRVTVAGGAKLNFERRSSMRVRVTVTDGVFATRLDDVITVNDVNDPPVFTGKDLFGGVVRGAVDEGDPAGTLVVRPEAASTAGFEASLELTATDEDAGAGATVTWGVERTNTAAVPFVVTTTPVGSRVALGSAVGASGLDFETLRAAAASRPSWSLRLDTSSNPSVPVLAFNVTVSDASGATARVPFLVTIRDVNERPEILGDSGAAAPDASAGTAAAGLRREVPENAAAGTPVAVAGFGLAVAAALAQGGAGLSAGGLSLARHCAVNASDVDVGQGMFFTLVPAGQGVGPPAAATPAGLFDVDRTTGVIRVLRALDREDTSAGGPVYFVRVRACDNGSPSLCDEADVRIEVLDVNEPPAVAKAQLYTLRENAAPGTEAAAAGIAGTPVAVSDPDAGDTVRFSIVTSMLDINGTGSTPLFVVGPTSGKLAVAPGTAVADIWTSPLSFESTPRARAFPVLGAASAPAESRATGNFFRVVVRACDSGANGRVLCDQATVVVALTDVQEPPRVVAGQSRSVTEQSPAGTAVGATPLRAEDQDAGQTASLRLFDVTSPKSALFAIASTGHATLRSSAPTLSLGETARPETLQVVATDGLLNSTAVAVTLVVAAENFRPVVQAASFSVPEDAPVGRLVGTISATDSNAGQVLTYFADAFVPSDGRSLFTVDEATGAVRVAAPLDHETLSSVVMTALAQDDGPGNKQGSATVTIAVTQVEEAPVVTGPLALVVNETTLAGEGPLPVPPLGADAAAVGAVRLFEPLGATTDSRWRASGSVAGSTAPGYSAVGYHWVATDAPMQARINATDEDAGQAATLRYSAAPVARAGGAGGYTTQDLAEWGLAAFPVAAHPTTGRLALVAGGIDFERLPPSEPWVSVNISVIDTAGLSAWAVLRLWVLDVNERVVASGAAFEVPETASPGEPLRARAPGSAGMTAVDPDLASLSHSSLRWAIASGNDEGRFAIDQATGQLRVAQAVDWEDRETYTLTITVADTPAASGAASAGGRVLPSLSATVTATVTVLNQADTVITRVFGATVHGSAGGEWVYFEGRNLGPTPRKLSAMTDAQSTGSVSGGGVAWPRVPALAGAGGSALRFSATYGPETGREYATVGRCERPAGTANNSLVRCMTGEARGALRWIVTAWHVADPTEAQSAAAQAAAAALGPGKEEDVWAPGLDTVSDEAVSSLGATRTRRPTIVSVSGAAALPTRGGARVRLTVTDGGPSWLRLVSRSVVYSSGDGIEYAPTNCSVAVPHTAIDCTTVVGYGSNVAWVLSLDGQSSPVLSSGSYEPPVVASLNVTDSSGVSSGRESSMSTRGGELVVIRGTGFGPAGTPVSAVYAGPAFDGTDVASAAVGSPVGGPYSGRSCFVAAAHTTIHCVTAPGVGSGMRWNVKIGALGGSQSTGPYARTPVSYSRPRVGSISGAGAFRASTEGDQPLVLSGAHLGPATFASVAGAPAEDAVPSQYPPTVRYGPPSNPARYTAANCRVDGVSHGRVVCSTVPGTGRGFVYTVSVGKQASEAFKPDGALADLAGYAAPVVSAYLGDGPGGRPLGSTEGGDRVEIQGKNFGPAGGSNLDRVFYGRLGADEYAGQTCRVLDHSRLQCDTDEGAGDQLQWTVIVDGQRSEAPSTSYGAPVITGFGGDAASNASSLGGETIDLIGRNFGPTDAWAAGRLAGGGDHSFLQGVAYGPTGVEYDAQACAVVSHTQIRCRTVPGSGSRLAWRVRVQGQTSEPSPAWSYREPRIAGVTPSKGDSSGRFRVTLVGTDFAVRDNFTSATVTVGDSPRQIPATNGRVLSPSDPVIAAATGSAQAAGRARALAGAAPFEALDFVMPPGTGRDLPIRLFLRMTDPDVGTSSETVASATVSFRFDEPVIEQVFSKDNSQELPGSVLLLIKGRSLGASSATGRLRLAYTFVEPVSWTHDFITVVSPVLEGSVHVQVWRGDPTETADWSASVFSSAPDTSGAPLVGGTASEAEAMWIESNGMVYTQRQPMLSPGMRAFFEPGSGATQPTPGQQLLQFEAQNVGSDGNLTEVLIGPPQLQWLDASGAQHDVFPTPRDNRCLLTGDPVLVNDTSGDSSAQRFRISCITPAGQGRALMQLQVLFAGSSSLDPASPISLPYLRPTFTGATVDATGEPAGEWIVTPVPGFTGGVYRIRVPTRGQRVALAGSNLGLIGYLDRFETPDHPDLNAIMPVEATPGDFSTTRYTHSSAVFDIPAGVAHAPLDPFTSPAAAVTPPGMPGPASPAVLARGSMNTTLSLLVGHPSFEYETADTFPPQAPEALVIVEYMAPSLGAQRHFGPTTGGAVLRITGADFGASVITAPRVTVGGRACALLNAAGTLWAPGDSRQYTPSTDPHTTARCIMPEGAGRGVPIRVRVGLQEAGSPAATADYDPPVIHRVWPQSGPTFGAVNVTIWGENFAGAGGAFIDKLAFEAVVGYHPTANPNATVINRARAERQGGRLVSANHSVIVVEMPPGQGGAKRLSLVIAGQEALTQWSTALPADSSDGVVRPAAGGPGDAALAVPVFRYDRPVVTKVTGACPTTGCEIIVTGSNFGTPVLSGGSIEQAVSIAPPASPTHPTQVHEPFVCSVDPSRPANESHSHSRISCIVPEGMGARLQLTVRAGTQVSDPVPFSYMPPEVRLFLPNSPSALGDVRLRLRGINLGTAIAPVNITLNDEPCDDPQLLTPHTQAVCTARKTVVGSKNVSVFVAWQERFFTSAQRLVAFECPPRFYGQPGEFCLACPQGAVCEGPVCTESRGLECGEYIEPYSAPGWWRAYASTPTPAGLCPAERQARPGKFAGSCPTFVPCEPSDACLGSNECSPAYAGERCAKCADGFFRFNSECAKCPDMPWLAPVLLSIGLMVVCIAGYALQRNEQLNIGPFLVAIDFAQVLASERLLPPHAQASSPSPPPCNARPSHRVRLP